MAGQAKHHTAREGLLRHFATLQGHGYIVVYRRMKSLLQARNAVAMKTHNRADARNAPDKAAIVFAVFNFGLIALVPHHIAHGFTPIKSKNSRAQRTWYGLASLAGWGRWKSARSPFIKKLTIEPPRLTHSAPRAINSDSMSAHSKLLGTGFSNMRARVLRCLLFMHCMISNLMPINNTRMFAL